VNDREAYEFYLDPEHLKPVGPGRRPKRRPLANMTAVRFTPEAIEAVKAVAHKEGITVSSWIRRLVQRELEAPETVEMTVEGLPEPLRFPADAVRAVTAAAMPAILRHGEVSLTLGSPHTGAERPAGLIPGSGRMGELKALPSSRSIGAARTFACPHMSIGGVVSATCFTCGPLQAAA
jgi:hypothetical protein